MGFWNLSIANLRKQRGEKYRVHDCNVDKCAVWSKVPNEGLLQIPFPLRGTIATRHCDTKIRHEEYSGVRSYVSMYHLSRGCSFLSHILYSPNQCEPVFPMKTILNRSPSHHEPNTFYFQVNKRPTPIICGRKLSSS